ncbi:MAG TPA: aminotransferase class I/II-fold pyridoxal phosphate-dependent enzyme [Myxococcota bacterium]|nr:aminotransferase class I/II-fold pyridoxal phosphate-dependent enzyme [Myxococcota bacterium]
MHFSDRTPGDFSLNSTAKALEKVSGRPFLDLTESNPTRCEFKYPKNLLKDLGKEANLIYEPFPFGHPEARQAVAYYLSRKGIRVDPDNIILTASTSEAYSYLFKLLANPGDSFLISTPGYPLLDHLARLEAVELLPYSLRAELGWPKI